jgi:hypothetical protein
MAQFSGFWQNGSRGYRGCWSPVDGLQAFRKQQADGSNPPIGSRQTAVGIEVPAAVFHSEQVTELQDGSVEAGRLTW